MFISRATAILLVYVLILPLSADLSAAAVELAWDPSPETNLAGYNIYRSSESGTFASAPLNGTNPITTTSFTDFTVPAGTYYYVVKAVNISGLESPPSNEVQTTVAPPVSNTPPLINAGADQTISLPATATLTAAATDDGLPNGTLNYLWSVVSGTGLTVASPTSSTTEVAFSTAGIYTLRITVGDGQFSSSDDVVVTVFAPKQGLVAPTGLSAQCNSNGKAVTLSWNPVSSAQNYYLRVDYLANNVNGEWYVADGNDYDLDAYTSTSFKGSVIAGENYNWWVHAANATAGIGPASSGTFRCPIVRHGRNKVQFTPTTRETVASKGSPASAPVREGRLYVEVDGRVNTGVFIANDATEDAAISFYFTDADGIDFGHGSFDLGARQSITSFVTEPPFRLPSWMEGTLTFHSSAPVTVAAFRALTNERDELLITTMPVHDPAAVRADTSIVLPQFADGAGWSTQVVLTNPTDTPLVGTVQFFAAPSSDASAFPLTLTVNGVADSSFQYRIAPRTAVRFGTVNEGTDIRVGYVLAAAEGNSAVPHGLSILSFSNQGITVSEAAVSSTSSGFSFRSDVEIGRNVRPAFALANPSDSPARMTLELTPLDEGSAKLTRSMQIPARGHIARFIDDLFPMIADTYKGMLRIVSTESISFTSLRLRNNERGDLLVTAMPVTTEAPLADNDPNTPPVPDQN